ncbi:hypothetical protein Ae717Ps2_0118c [Pseudonocardia sp. Ae717_Ps2]|nr:hypothetical protein Ae717Ps2_0118c [Pseudonocardia sp. Ae717_Ps2]
MIIHQSARPLRRADKPLMQLDGLVSHTPRKTVASYLDDSDVTV